VGLPDPGRRAFLGRDSIVDSLKDGEKIELRGFGSFRIRRRGSRTGRNPKTGDAVALPGKHVPHFKPGKELRERVSEVMPLPSED
jgi:integration host factor subunit beta